MQKSAPAKPATRVRSLAEADPTYAAAKELVTRLKASAGKLDAEESELLHRLGHRPAVAEKTGRVAKLLGDAQPDDDEAPDGVSARLKAIAGERVDLRAAVNIAHDRLAKARFGASKAICDEVRGEYTARVKALAAALLAAHEEHEALLSLTNELSAQDVAWTGHLLPMQAHGIFGHEGGKLSIWLHEAALAGFIAKAKIPKELHR
ncbi:MULTISPECIES: hypothetical protein [Rhizobium]|jgi:hypothetical protein|uniref:hypothetical protein n=1 Tax=Rhizobium TaxID=379 RepID=UPI00052303C1|nr:MULTISPECIES: hypothetical protein [Rhizobium]KPN28043.1 hypothetical protein KS05_06840 [Rhizobium brockwellii]QJX06186.1 hypothetical protein RLCC275e_14925 [Rhizobium brockwellii]TAY89036.1 hypothetical protein ELH83_15155 [Rhizobium leguminosarum]